ncbi:helix-turn-helix domain-containing protein [Streptomyces sp. NPDC048191]|uniref:TetR/AcrR family transcriptional regulator n=1 Tax=Streptomyces sp. NPDC048191 TaxID=3155484 RepID=UPI0033CFBF2A
MRERDGNGTKARILEIARELMAKQGYAGTSIAHIANQLGTSKAGIYYHFKSKEEILDALLTKPVLAYADIAERAAQGAPPEELLGAIIDLTLELKAFAGFHDDPSALHALSENTRQADIVSKQARIIDALAGPGASQAARVRARSAFSVASDGTAGVEAASASGLTAADREELLAAALRALEPVPVPARP